MTNYKKSLGKWGERLAATFLESNGYTIVAQNVHTPYGEIDLIAQTGETLVFVEVKTRQNTRYGFPEAGVHREKQAHMLAAAEAYLQKLDIPCTDWRIDVIAILRSSQEPEIVHFENVIN
jgi:putative endonuclease